MRQIREVLRLRHSSGLSQHAIARSLGMSQGAVSNYLAAARRAGLTWPLSPELDDDVKLEALLFPAPPNVPVNSRPLPDWASLHRDLRRPGVTLNLLWEEYRAGAPEGVGYSCYVVAKFMLREWLYLAGSLRAGRSLTQHNPMLGVADLVSTEVRHGSKHLSQS
jgi:transcriptional regulator with XRE-family HTH domain